MAEHLHLVGQGQSSKHQVCDYLPIPLSRKSRNLCLHGPMTISDLFFNSLLDSTVLFFLQFVLK